MKKYSILGCGVLGLFWLAPAYAQSLGDLASHALSPVQGLTAAFTAACYIIGIGLLLGSFVRYTEHRRNPQEIRITMPILLFVFGLALVGLPLIAQYSPGSIAAGQPGRGALQDL